METLASRFSIFDDLYGRHLKRFVRNFTYEQDVLNAAAYDADENSDVSSDSSDYPDGDDRGVKSEDSEDSDDNLHSLDRPKFDVAKHCSTFSPTKTILRQRFSYISSSSALTTPK